MTRDTHLGLLLGKSNHGAQPRFLQSLHGHDQFRVDAADDFPSFVLLDVVGKADQPALQYFDGGKSRDKHIHHRKRFYETHSDVLPGPDCPFWLTIWVGKVVELAMSVFDNSREAQLILNEYITAVTLKAQVLQ